MLLFDSICKEPPGPTSVNAVSLPYEARQRSRARIVIASGPHAGEAAGIDLERGTVLRGGIVLSEPGGQLLRIEAAAETLTRVRAGPGASLAMLAYHLGNRHVPVEITQEALYLADDHVLADMVTGLGGQIAVVERPFEPEAGAYRSGHSHTHDHGDDQSSAPPSHGHAHGAQVDRQHAPRIHDLSADQGTR